MPLTAQEIKRVRCDLRRAHELVSAAFETANTARVSNLSRSLRDIGNFLGDVIADLSQLEIASPSKDANPIKGGGDA